MSSKKAVAIKKEEKSSDTPTPPSSKKVVATKEKSSLLSASASSDVTITVTPPSEIVPSDAVVQGVSAYIVALFKAVAPFVGVTEKKMLTGLADVSPSFVVTIASVATKRSCGGISREKRHQLKLQ